MKIRVKTISEISVQYLKINVPVDFEDEDMSYDFPGRKNSRWEVTFNLETGTIEFSDEFTLQDWHDWFTTKGLDLILICLKVRDGGSYYLLDEHKQEVGRVENNYVPYLLRDYSDSDSDRDYL